MKTETKTSQHETTEAPGFEGGSGIAQVQDQVGAVAAVAREESELRAAIIVAKKFPRVEQSCYTKLLKSCERPSFAESATYCFPRGGQSIEGPSVDLAREAARCWGNIRYGLRIVSEDEERIHIKGAAIDLETNNYVEGEDKFQKLIFRKVGGWQKPDERDLRELVNRRGAILVRNALLQLLPPDVVEDAVRQAKETMAKAARGDIEQNREDTIRRLARGFFNLGVTAEMLAQYVGHALDIITKEEIVKLRGVYKSLLDGNSKREEYFDLGGSRPTATGSVDLDAVSVSTAPAKTKPDHATPPPAATPTEPPAMSEDEKKAAVAREKVETKGKKGLF